MFLSTSPSLKSIKVYLKKCLSTFRGYILSSTLSMCFKDIFIKNLELQIELMEFVENVLSCKRAKPVLKVMSQIRLNFQSKMFTF